MKRRKLAPGGVVRTVLFLWMGATAFLHADTNPGLYSEIVTNNPFRLKEPPPPVDPSSLQPPAPPVPLATVELTGISTVSGPAKALLEIIPGPGKQMLKPILSVGERAETVEVVSIDVDKNQVTVKNAGTITNLTFRVAKATPATPASPTTLPLPNRSPVPSPAAPAPRASYNEIQTGSGRTVVMAGGEHYQNPQPTAAPGVQSGLQPGATSGLQPNNLNSGFRSIPSRSIRTPGGLPTFPNTGANPNGQAGQNPEPQMSREEQLIHIEANRQLNPPNFPPLPPTLLSPQQQQP